MRGRLVRYEGPVDPLHNLLVTCGRELFEHDGLDHWMPAYPRARLARDIDQGAVYSLEGSIQPDGEPVAIVTLGRQQPAYYGDPSWSLDEPAIYVSRFAVALAHQGSGMGTMVMHEVQRYAASAGASWVRLDANLAQAQRLVRAARLHPARVLSVAVAPVRPDAVACHRSVRRVK